jgi:peptide/nickel transport system substrate-binding protein
MERIGRDPLRDVLRARLSRRAALKRSALLTTGLALGGGLLQACGGGGTPPPAAPPAATAPPAKPTEASKPAAAGAPAAKPTEAAAKPQAAPAAGGAPRGQITVAMSQDLQSLDTANHVNISDWSVHRHIFDPLVEKDYDGNFVPMLAESWSLVDETTWQFNLRRGVKFHNGEEFTAESVKATMERMLPGSQLAQAGLFWTALKEIEIKDPYTVLLRGSLPIGSMLHNLTMTEMLPAQALQNADEFFRKPAGTGPFKFVNWAKGDRIEFEANREYWKPGVPKVEKATIRFIPEGSTRLAGLKAGEIDIVDRLPFEEEASIKANPDLTWQPVVGVESQYIGFQCEKPPFDDKRVRQALNYGTDKETIIKELLLGNGKVADAPMAPGIFAYAAQTPYSYDPEKAQSLLKEAGVQGGQIELIVLKGLYTKGLEVAQAVAAQWQKLGFTVSVNDMEVARTREVRAAGTFDTFFAGWVTMSRDADFALWRNFHSTTTGQFRNVSQVRYSNPQVDKLLETGQTSIKDEDRARAYAEAQKIIWDEAPWVFLYYTVNAFGVRKRVEGWRSRPDYFTLVKEVGVTG